MTTSPLPLAGMSALVTGGGTGIGRASAAALLADGATVTIMGRRAEVLDETAAELRGSAPDGAEVRTAAGDVADEGAVEAAVEVAAADGLDLAVLAAGTGTVGPVTDLPVEEWRRVVDCNLTGTFLALKHAARAMIATGRGGAVVTISSIAGARSHRWMGPYCASKAGIDSLVEVAADELGRHGIRVSSVRPGIVQTDLGDHLIASPEVLADYREQMPISRVGHVDEVAAAVRFLCGPESSWISGVALSVDGGMHVRRGPDLDPFARALYGDAAVDPTVTPPA